MKNQTDLQQQLKSFGLNPKLWQIIKTIHGDYLVQNKKDKNFTFKGIANQHPQVRWEHLTLESL